jgi:D-alanine-D-alanine ligase
LSKKLRVGVIFGGRSGEHEVSLVSATSIMSALDRDKYEVVPIGITKTGKWIAGGESLQLLKEGKESAQLHTFLPADPTEKRLLPAVGNSSRLTKIADVDDKKIDVVFPMVHGTFGEDGTLQGLLELADIPYVGAGVLGSAVGMDKIVQKNVCRQFGLPVVDFLWFKVTEWEADKTRNNEPGPLLYQLAGMTRVQMIEAIVEKLGLPVFVKPANLGSSVGISKAHDEKELLRAIAEACLYDRKILVEKAVQNAREIEVSVLGNDHPYASVPGEVIPSNEFYDYDAKYVDGASTCKIPAELPDNLSAAIRQTAVKAFLAVEVEGMARVDFLLDRKTGEFFLCELNTIPGFTQISMYPKLWQASGMSYSELLDELIRLAIERHERRKSLRTTYQPKKEWYK